MVACLYAWKNTRVTYMELRKQENHFDPHCVVKYAGADWKTHTSAWKSVTLMLCGHHEPKEGLYSYAQFLFLSRSWGAHSSVCYCKSSPFLHSKPSVFCVNCRCCGTCVFRWQRMTRHLWSPLPKYINAPLCNSWKWACMLYFHIFMRVHANTRMQYRKLIYNII